LSNRVSSQIQLHAEYGGVVPELAAREHLRNLMPVAQGALCEARVAPDQLDAVVATRGPGLPSALLVGFKAAQAMAFALRKPFLGVHHHEAHLYSPWIGDNPAALDLSTFEPNVSLIVSGGHTMLVHVRSELQHGLLGATLDDAAGECFDKVGKLLGLPYPAGPEIDRLAERGNPRSFNFPRPMIRDANDDFSFSGLKTSVRYFLRDHPELLADTFQEPTFARPFISAADAADKPDPLPHAGSEGRGETGFSGIKAAPPLEARGRALHDLCASVQAAIVEVLVAKTMKAARRLGVNCVTASGGVTCNRALRRDLAAACRDSGFALRLAPPRFCTDNAAMIGVLAERKLAALGGAQSLTQEILPNWELDEA
jgi:tRNA N6-adenosine threonylcarbamoyltransferase